MRNLPYQASMAVAFGLPYNEALKIKQLFIKGKSVSWTTGTGVSMRST